MKQRVLNVANSINQQIQLRWRNRSRLFEDGKKLWAKYSLHQQQQRHQAFKRLKWGRNAADLIEFKPVLSPSELKVFRAKLKEAAAAVKPPPGSPPVSGAPEAVTSNRDSQLRFSAEDKNVNNVLGILSSALTNKIVVKNEEEFKAESRDHFDALHKEGLKLKKAFENTKKLNNNNNANNVANVLGIISSAFNNNNNSSNNVTAKRTNDAKNNPNSTVISKKVVDSRTKSCVRALFPSTSAPDWRQIRRLEVFCSHLHRFPFAKGAAVREGAVGRLLHLRRLHPEESPVTTLTREALHLLGHRDPPRGEGIRILSMDGGGMRGVVALEVLKQVELVTGKKIHQLFDFICGVSTGAIIAAFLAFSKLSIAEIERIYDELGKKVFTRDVIRGATGWVMTHSYYDTRLYEETLRQFVGTMRMDDTVRCHVCLLLQKFTDLPEGSGPAIFFVKTRE